jgi:eukaryotic-like serine/threonine-protein kinase
MRARPEHLPMTRSKSGEPDPTAATGSLVPGSDQVSPEISLERTTARASAPANISSFLPGEVLAGRFRIVRVAGRGGMGEVYEAEDLELKERVALKTIRFELAQRERTAERFKREIQLARKVTHANVCRTFDVFRHVEPNFAGEDGEQRVTLVVSMELLAGETLEQRIRRAGRMPSGEALPIVTQMAAGLQAAHEAGVVHRDFKSSNVMLVPAGPGSASGQGSNGLRAVITDFGLAHAESGNGQSLTRAEDLVGTPAYMAPEQLQGGRITPATDIYALGVVLFEMLTAKLPFTGDSPLSTALKRLKEPAPSPRTIVPDVEAPWEQAIARCLQLEPANRFGTTQDVVRALGGEKVPLAPGSVDVQKRWRFAVSLTAAMLILAAVGFLAARFRFQLTKKSRPSVAVLGFKNLSGEPDLNLWGDELAENLGSQLDTDEIRFISPARVDELKRDLGLTEISESLPPSTLAKIHEQLGCDVVVVGSYSVAGGATQREIAWNVHLENTVTGESLGTVSQTMLESERLTIARRVGQNVRAKLGINTTAEQAAKIDAQGPSNEEASMYFAEGRAKQRDFDLRGAGKMFERAVGADPKFAEAHSALADTWSLLGYDAKALEEAQRAFDLSPGLTEEKGGLIKGRYYEMTHDWDKATALYSSLWNLFEGTPEYGLLLARSQVSAGKANEALTTLGDLQKHEPPLGIEAQADLEEADARGSLADFQGQLKAADAAADKAKTLGSGLILARARIPQCLASIGLGEPQKAKPLCQEAKDLNQAAGDQLGTARATNAIANGLSAHGDRTEALAMYQQALQIARAIGDKYDQTGALNNIGMIEDATGDAEGAKRAYNESIEVAIERGDKVNLALAQQNLAGVFYEQGDRAKATDLYRKAVQLAHEIGAKDTEARALNNLCMIADDSGELMRALEACRQSLSLRKEIGDKSGMGNSLDNIGDILANQGDLSGATQNYEQALQLQDSIGAKGDAAYSQTGLADVALRAGEAAESRNKAEAAAQEFQREKDPAGEAQARGLLAEILLDSGDAAGARSQIEQASKLAQQAGDQGLKLDAAIGGAKIDAQAGHADQAVKTLQSVQKDAKAAGLVRIEFEARLGLGEALMKAGKTASGRATLKALAQDAKTKGFGYIATKAAKES